MKIQALDAHLMDTLTNIIKELKNYHTTDDQLKIAKDHVKSTLTGLETVMPPKKALLDFFNIVHKDYVSKAQIEAELDKITCDSFYNQVNNLYEAVSFVTLFHGTTGEDTVKQAAKLLEGSFNGKPSPKNLKYLNLHAHLKGNNVFANQLTNRESITHAVMNVFQVGKEELSSVFKASLIKSIIGKLSFVELRTFKQLGYSCKTTLFAESGVLYMLMSVHGSVKTPELMDVDVDEAIAKIEPTIKKIKEKAFRAKVNETIRKLTSKDKSLKIRSTRLWKEMMTGRNFFNVGKFDNEEHRRISKEQLLKFYESVFGKKMSKLSIQEFSHKTPVKKLKHVFRGVENNFVAVNTLRDRGLFINNKY